MNKQQNAIGSVHLLSVGPFGHSVGNYLRIFRDDVHVTPVNDNTIPLPDTWPDSRIIAVAAWRPVPTLCELLNQLSFERYCPFLPLILDSSILRLGPIVSPGNGACWNCWVRRSHQHSAWPKEQSALLQHYASYPDFGPQGYLEPFAMMGAAKITEAINSLDSSTAIPGHIWQIDMLTRKIATSTVVGIHDCPRCGLHRPVATRSFAEMQRGLAYLWSREV